jgi:hypothetical protein
MLAWALSACVRCRRRVYPHAENHSVFDGGAGVCVRPVACVPACAGAVGPPSAVVLATTRAASESPASGPNVLTLFFAAAYVGSGTAGVRAAVDRSRCRHHACGLPVVVHCRRSTVGGGFFNVASAYASVVCGGDANVASGTLGAVGGGYTNIASGG